MVHVRGWAFGAPVSSKISRAEAAALQADILAAMNEDERAQIKFLAPFMHNHMITAEVRHPSYDAVKDAADSVNTAIVRNSIMVRGCTPRAGIEMSPSRRESLKSWFSSKDHPVKLNADRAFAWCERALEA